MADIESAGFTPAAFASSAADRLAKIALPPPAGSMGNNGDSFGFGTALEKKIDEQQQSGSSSSRAVAEMEKEGLCHPNLFGDEKAREKKWVAKLFKLRKSLMRPSY